MRFTRIKGGLGFFLASISCQVRIMVEDACRIMAGPCKQHLELVFGMSFSEPVQTSSDQSPTLSQFYNLLHPSKGGCEVAASQSRSRSLMWDPTLDLMEVSGRRDNFVSATARSSACVHSMCWVHILVLVEIIVEIVERL